MKTPRSNPTSAAITARIMTCPLLPRLRRLHLGLNLLVMVLLAVQAITGGRDLLEKIRIGLGYGKRALPVLVMTGDANPANQSELLRAGPNDLVQKPIEERLLVTKVLFQLRLARMDASRALV